MGVWSKEVGMRAWGEGMRGEGQGREYEGLGEG